jgi:LCP family protein required for cell wall assembly
MLGWILVATVLLVPNADVSPAESTLVKVERSQGIDLSPDVIWILALGSDARLGQDVDSQRADAIQLVGINTKTGASTAIGIPRDSYVAIDGSGSNRINAALYFGGPQLMAEEVKDLIGIEPDYVFVTSFFGLRDMVNDIGGITVRSPYSFSDPYLHPTPFRVGLNKLRGQEAVAFSRIRKSLPGGDFDRSRNQQRTIAGIQARIAANADRPGFLDRGVLSVLAHMDTNVSPAEMFRIAQAIAQVDPKKITGCVVTGGFANIGGASVVTPNVALAQRYGNDARRDATIPNC